MIFQFNIDGKMNYYVYFTNVLTFFSLLIPIYDWIYPIYECNFNNIAFNIIIIISTRYIKRLKTQFLVYFITINYNRIKCNSVFNIKHGNVDAGIISHHKGTLERS